MAADACHRCGRRTAFRFWSWQDATSEEIAKASGGKIKATVGLPLTLKVPFCTWFCARAHHQATGHAVEDDQGKLVFSPTDERVFARPAR